MLLNSLPAGVLARHSIMPRRALLRRAFALVKSDVDTGNRGVCTIDRYHRANYRRFRTRPAERLRADCVTAREE